jgi:hypothetical protein
MKLSQLAAKPTLIKLMLDDAALVEKHGEAIEFYTYDRQPLDIFMRLASIDQSNVGNLIDVVRTLILDEAGKQIIVGDTMLPTDVLIAAVAKITETLGK